MIKNLLRILFSDTPDPQTRTPPIQKRNDGVHPEAKVLSNQAIAAAFTAWRGQQSIPNDLCKDLDSNQIVKELNNRNGYIREFCLDVLDTKNEIKTLGNVLKRLNDYVPQIRKKAQKLSKRWLIECDIKTLVEILDHIIALEKQSRVQVYAIRALVLARFAEEKNQAALLKGLNHKDHRISKAAWHFSTEIFNWSPTERVKFAIATKNPQVISLVICHFAHLDSNEILYYFKNLSKLRDPMAKRSILNLAVNRNLVDQDSIAENALWDKNSGVRWIARKFILDLGERDYLLCQYTQEISAHACVDKTLYAIEGLVNTKYEGMNAVLTSLIDSHHIRIWQEAICLLCQYDRSSGYAILQTTLQTGDREKQFLVFKIAGRMNLHIPFALIKQFAILRREDEAAAQKILNYAESIGGWTGLEIASAYQELSDDVQLKMQNIERNYLHKWAFSQNFTSPTLNQIETITRYLNAKKLEQLGSLGQQLEFCINEEIN